MLTYIGIIIGCICLVLIAVLGYFLYRKIGTQQMTIEQLVERQLTIEGKMMRPPPGEEVHSLLLDVAEDCEDCEDCEVVPVKFDEVAGEVDQVDEDYKDYKDYEDYEDYEVNEDYEVDKVDKDYEIDKVIGYEVAGEVDKVRN